MKRINKAHWIAVIVVVLAIAPSLAPPTASSQALACPEIVREAFTATDQFCASTARNQACYGHVLLNAKPQPSVERLVFERTGDRVNVADLQTLRLSAMDEDAGLWGVALMHLQANLAESEPAQNIMMLLFGEVEVANAVVPVPTVEVTVSAPGAINIRTQPSTRAPVMGALAPGETVTVSGRLEDNSWLRVRLPGGQRTGWVYGRLVESEDNISKVAVVDPRAIDYTPMQAFYFRSGMNDSACPEAPDSGILIQTPEGVAKVTLLINEVDIQLGSTVYFRAQPASEMIVTVIEGSARVAAAGAAYTAIGGTEITVPLDETLAPAGPPNPPRPYDMASLVALPLASLDRPVVLQPPLTEEEVVALIEATAEPPTGDGTGPDGGLPPGLIDNPGLTDNPALSDGLPPGHGGTPPGQQKKDK